MANQIGQGETVLRVTLDEAEADAWCDGGIIGRIYRAELRERFGEVQAVEIVDRDGVVLDAWRR